MQKDRAVGAKSRWRNERIKCPPLWRNGRIGIVDDAIGPRRIFQTATLPIQYAGAKNHRWRQFPRESRHERERQNHDESPRRAAAMPRRRKRVIERRWRR